MARRLIERGVSFVEVALGDGLGWDTHAEQLHRGEATVGGARRRLGHADDGAGRARPARIDDDPLDGRVRPHAEDQPASAGRDHFPAAWTCVLAGGGITGGQAYGRTSADGMTVEENPVAIGDVLATLCTALGVPPETENVTPEDRPIKIAEGTPIDAILA